MAVRAFVAEKMTKRLASVAAPKAANSATPPSSPMATCAAVTNPSSTSCWIRWCRAWSPVGLSEVMVPTVRP